MAAARSRAPARAQVKALNSKISRIEARLARLRSKVEKGTPLSKKELEQLGAGLDALIVKTVPTTSWLG